LTERGTESYADRRKKKSSRALFGIERERELSTENVGHTDEGDEMAARKRKEV